MFGMPAHRKIFVSAGQRFGRGVVLDPEIRVPRGDRPNGDRGARLRCDCGQEFTAQLRHLYGGDVVSCGCRRRESCREIGRAYVTHGLAGHPLYDTYRHMLERCENPEDKRYARYGGRGIRVCARWHDLRLFIEDIERDLGPRPDDMTLDRINVDGDYRPGNVRWATIWQQRANRS